MVLDWQCDPPSGVADGEKELLEAERWRELLEASADDEDNDEDNDDDDEG